VRLLPLDRHTLRYNGASGTNAIGGDALRNVSYLWSWRCSKRWPRSQLALRQRLYWAEPSGTPLQAAPIISRRAVYVAPIPTPHPADLGVQLRWVIDMDRIDHHRRQWAVR
jgi:hypothetical protein